MRTPTVLYSPVTFDAVQCTSILVDNIHFILHPFLTKILFYSTKLAQMLCLVQTHSYIYNWSLLSFSQDYDLASYMAYVMCVILYLRLKAAFMQQICEKLFYGNFISSPSFSQKSAERKLPKKYFFIFYLIGGISPRI